VCFHDLKLNKSGSIIFLVFFLVFLLFVFLLLFFFLATTLGFGCCGDACCTGGLGGGRAFLCGREWLELDRLGCDLDGGDRFGSLDVTGRDEGVDLCEIKSITKIIMPSVIRCANTHMQVVVG
jgi:hypothetical protein